MRKSRPAPPREPDPDTRPPFASPARQRLSRLLSFEVREHWWNLVDTWETRSALRFGTYLSAALAILVTVIWTWGYPWWTKRNAFRMATQWIAAGRLQNASEVIQQTLVNDPDNPEGWHFAAEIARRRGNKSGAVGYSRRAAALAPERPELTAEWASDALLADQSEEAERALATLSRSDLAASALAQRLLGEIARRRFQLTAARDYFETALKLDGPLAVDEVPLGAVLLNSRDHGERQRGLTLLGKHTGDLEWGANALRALLSDATARDDHPAMIEWAERLRAHPRCTLGDVPNCLLALARADASRYANVLATLEKKHAVNGDQATLLLDWLNQIGQPAEAVRWALSLPSKLTQKAPLIAAVAEAMRRSENWTELGKWVETGSWDSDVEFIRLAFAFHANRKLHDSVRADQIWRTLQSSAQTNGVRALFAANLLYTWGEQTESLALLWNAAELPGVALEALGTLARHYQVQRDAEGQYQAFRRLYSLRSQDSAIANNYAFFAALTGNDLAAARAIAEENFSASPGNAVYRATFAYVQLAQSHASDALATVAPVAGDWRTSPAVAFVYGLALAKNNRKPEARPILDSLEATNLTLAEVAQIKAALN